MRGGSDAESNSRTEQRTYWESSLRILNPKKGSRSTVALPHCHIVPLSDCRGYLNRTEQTDECIASITSVSALWYLDGPLLDLGVVGAAQYQASQSRKDDRMRRYVDDDMFDTCTYIIHHTYSWTTTAMRLHRLDSTRLVLMCRLLRLSEERGSGLDCCKPAEHALPPSWAAPRSDWARC